jgi:hypothetical protein
MKAIYLTFSVNFISTLKCEKILVLFQWSTSFSLHIYSEIH